MSLLRQQRLTPRKRERQRWKRKNRRHRGKVGRGGKVRGRFRGGEEKEGDRPCKRRPKRVKNENKMRKKRKGLRREGK